MGKRFTLPTPLHGWRQFVGEVGIVLLGVLAALAAQQLVESVQMRDAAQDLRASMRDELADNRARWHVNHSRYPCAVASLRRLEEWSRSGQGGPISETRKNVGLWNTHVSAWAVASNSPAQAYLPLKERNLYAEAYQILDRQQMTIFAASEGFRKVTALAQVADDPENRRLLRLAAAETRVALGQLDANFEFLERRFEALGVQPDPSGINPESKPLEPCAPLLR